MLAKLAAKNMDQIPVYYNHHGPLRGFHGHEDLDDDESSEYQKAVPSTFIIPTSVYL